MLRVTVVYTGLQGMPAVNQLYFQGSDATSAQLAVDEVQALFLALAPSISDSVTVDISGQVAEMAETTGDILAFYAVTGYIIPGTSESDPLPIGTSLVAGFLTDQIINSRRLQGRIYIPGLTEFTVGQTGVLTGPDVSALEGILEDAFASESVVHLVWSRPFAGDDDNAPRLGSTSAVTAYRVPPVLSSLRTRRR